MLSLTADNATNMDKMSKYLEKKVVAYSSVNHTCCFNHVLSLTGKALLRQFDVKNKVGNGNGNSEQVLSAEGQELLDLAEGIDDKELTMTQEMGTENEDKDTAAVEDLEELDEWLDEVSNKMTEEEHVVLAANIQPVSQVLIKVRCKKRIPTLLMKSPAP